MGDQYTMLRRAIIEMFPDDPIAYGQVLELTDRFSHEYPMMEEKGDFGQQLAAIIEEAKKRLALGARM